MKDLMITREFSGSWWATEPLYAAMCIEAGAMDRRRFYWTTEPDSLHLLDSLRLLWIERTGAHLEAVIEVDEALILLELDAKGAVSVLISHELESGRDHNLALTKIKEVLPEANPHERHEVELTFWTMDRFETARSLVRMLAVPEWKEIASNYPAAVTGSLEDLMSWDSGPGVGSFLLWHGEAGTGKTHALRALAWEWREWCDFEFVVDPEEFFSKPAYMLHALLNPDGARRSHDGRWSVLVLEDTGELLSVDARTTLGQGLSRFLNLTDGVLGQGLNLMVLVTTNEPLSSLHPAVSRPGRCASIVEIPSFSKSEASEWLLSHGLGAASRSMRLADLFAASRGETDLVKTPKPVGFGAK